MSRKNTVYCEECLEDIPGNQTYWEGERLFCRQCGSEMEPPDEDIFDSIMTHRAGMVFRDEFDDKGDDEDEEKKKKKRKGVVELEDEEDDDDEDHGEPED